MLRYFDFRIAVQGPNCNSKHLSVEKPGQSRSTSPTKSETHALFVGVLSRVVSPSVHRNAPGFTKVITDPAPLNAFRHREQWQDRAAFKEPLISYFIVPQKHSPEWSVIIPLSKFE